MRARAPPAPSDIIGLTLQAVANRHDPAAAMAGQAWNRPWLRPARDLRRHFDQPGFAGETLPGPAVAAIAALLAGAGGFGRWACHHPAGGAKREAARAHRRRGLEPVPFASAHCTGSKLLFVEHLYPLKRFRLNG